MSRKVNGIEWTPNPDGEYGEHTAKINGHDVVVSSDREGEQWDCRIDEGDLFRLESESLDEALREATQEAKR